jgi:type I restriction enzyme S subunit
MSFPRYAEYKPSGVEWLGEVPSHWSAGPLKHIVDRIESGTSVNAIDDAASTGQVGVLKTSCVYTGQFRAEENKLVVLEDLDRVTCPLRSGTLIVSRMNTPDLVGAAGYVLDAPEGIFLPDRLWQVSFKNALPKFVHYWTQSDLYRASVKAACSGTSASMQNLGQDQFKSFPFAAATLDEQTSIAAFLDRETGKIDALVAEQEKLIALLKEKRQAVISHAVTKGLNPQAPMKPSGIDWLGDVPAHWEVRRVKHFVCLFEQGWSPQCEGYAAEGDEWAVLKVGCVNGGRFTRSENKVLPPDLLPIPELGLRKGDLLVSRANTRELVGSAAAIAVDEPKLLLCDKLYRIRFGVGTLKASFVAHYLATPGARGEIELGATGASASMVNIGQATILEMSIAVPPYDEQADILKAIQAATARTDQLLAAAESAITLLKERRSALISAAVTGQIDVRGLATL